MIEPVEESGAAEGDGLEEKPKGEIGTAIVVGAGLLAVTGFAVWFMNRPRKRSMLLGPTAPSQPLQRVARCPEGQVLSTQGQCVPAQGR